MDELLETINNIITQIKDGTFDPQTYFRDANGLMGEKVIGQEILEYVLNDIVINRKELEEQLKNKRSAYRSKSKDSNLDAKNHRTYNIVKDGQGKFHLFIEVKQKLMNGEKPSIAPDLPSGADYTMKVAYQVGSTCVTPYASLVARYDQSTEEGQDKLKRLQKAAEISNKFDGIPGFCTTILGEPRDGKLTVYAPYRPEGTLESMLNIKIESTKRSDTPKPTTDSEKIDLMKQLLDILTLLNEKKISHKDIKPENLLISKNTNGSTVLELADFGYSLRYRSPDTYKFSPFFVNPHILAEQNRSGMLEHFREKFEIYITDVLGPVPNTFEKSFKANSSQDTYAVGKIIFGLTYGAYPESFTNNAAANIISNDPLLSIMLGKNSASGMLSPDYLMGVFKASRNPIVNKPPIMFSSSHTPNLQSTLGDVGGGLNPSNKRLKQ